MIIKINYRFLAMFFIVVMLICFAFSKIFATEDAEFPGINLPVIMYHHISADRKAHNDYVISPEELESDFRYIKTKGYTPILPEDLVRYVKNEAPLPEKPIILTFDDGFESVYHYAYPMAKKHKVKFVVAVFGKETEHFSEINDHNVLYSYMTWDEIKELSESGICEIANHTYSLHKTTGRRGVKINPGESIEAYTKTVSEDILHLQTLLVTNSLVLPRTFVYPYGFSCEESEKLIKDLEFEVSFSCVEGINKITKDKNCLYLLKRYNRPHGIDSESFFEKRKI